MDYAKPLQIVVDAARDADPCWTDLARGCLLWGAVGDALGRPVETWDVRRVRERFGPDDPRQVILTAVNAGRDADSVASMAGNLAGARNGAERLRRECPEWWTDLEYRDELIHLADGLAGLEAARRDGLHG